MATNDRVSIVLPTFNGERYLVGALESCLSQTHENLELIVVVDGSTDGTRDLLETIDDPRVIILDRRENLGLPESLNEGFRHASGAFLTWTSDDNRFKPHALQRMLEVFAQHSEAGMVCASYDVIDGGDHIIGRCQVGPAVDIWLRNVVGACFLYRRVVRETVGDYSPASRLFEDYEYWLRTSLNYYLVPFDESLYEYRQHGASLTGRMNTLDRAKSVADMKLGLGGRSRSEWRSERAAIDMAHAFEFASVGEAGKVWGPALKAIARHPFYLANRGVWAILSRTLRPRT